MNQVEAFVRECLEYSGGVVDEPEPGVLEALVPGPLRSVFPGGELVELALESEVAGLHPGALPVLPGSETLDGLIAYALQEGRISSAAPRTGAVRSRSVLGELLRTLTFAARRVQLPEGAAQVEPVTVAQFDWVVSLVSDDREESLQSIVVDLWSGRASAPLSRICRTLEVDPPHGLANRRLRITLEEAYLAARAALQTWQVPRIQRHQALVARRLEAAYGRQRLYYDSMLEDLVRRKDRASSEDRARDLEAKAEATRAERDSKLAELQEKYRLRPGAQLASVRLLTYSRLFGTIHLERKHVSRELEVCWDPLTSTILLPACDACGADSSHLELGLDSQLRCRLCVENGR